MFLPIGDTPNPSSVPYINYALIALNLAVFFLITLPLSAAAPDFNDPLLLEYLQALGVRGPVPVQSVLDHVSAYDLIVFKYGFRPVDPSLLDLFSAMFLHAGWMHLAGNMLFLWIFGDNVEHRLGHFGYLVVYLVTGVAATLFFAVFVPRSPIPLVGASGAISGLLGCYYLWFPRNKVKTFVFLFPFFMDTLYIPARFVLGFYLLVDNILPFLFTLGKGTGVAHGAHIGGFVAGLGLAYGVDRVPGLLSHRENHKKAKVAPAAGPEPSGMATGEQIARYIRMEKHSQAAACYMALAGRIERSQVASEDTLAIGEYLLSSGNYDRALFLYRRFIAERPTDPALDKAYLGAGKAMIHKPRCITSAYQYFLSALDVAQSQGVAEEARMHLRAIERLGEK